MLLATLLIFLAGVKASMVEPMNDALFKLRSTEGLKGIPLAELNEVGIANPDLAKLPSVDNHADLQEIAQSYADALFREERKKRRKIWSDVWQKRIDEAKAAAEKNKRPYVDPLTPIDKVLKERNEREAKEDDPFAAEDATLLAATPAARYAKSGAQGLKEIVAKGNFPDAPTALSDMRKILQREEVEEPKPEEKKEQDKDSSKPAAENEKDKSKTEPLKPKKIKVNDYSNLKALLADNTISYGIGYRVDNAVNPPTHYWVLALSSSPNVNPFKCNCEDEEEEAKDSPSSAENGQAADNQTANNPDNPGLPNANQNAQAQAQTQTKA